MHGIYILGMIYFWFWFAPELAYRTLQQILLYSTLSYFFVDKVNIRGNLGSKMGLIRKQANNNFCELEFKNQYNFNKMSQP